MFGTSGVKRIGNDELMIERLTLKAPKDHSENLHVKSIVKPSLVKSCRSPHYCHFHPGYYQVNEDMVHFDGPRSPYISVDEIRINHYWSRDEEFFYNIKIPRRQKRGEGADGCLRRNTRLNCEEDTVILRFAEDLKKRLFGYRYRHEGKTVHIPQSVKK
ncbi:MAG: hypothetical protein WB791_09255 [Waddliaceae bacterium]